MCTDIEFSYRVCDDFLKCEFVESGRVGSRYRYFRVDPTKLTRVERAALAAVLTVRQLEGDEYVMLRTVDDSPMSLSRVKDITLDHEITSVSEVIEILSNMQRLKIIS